MMLNKYENEMMDLASKLDAVTNSCGEITGFAYKIADKQDEEALQCLLKAISDITKKEVNPTKEVRQLAKALKDSLISYFGYCYVKKVINDAEESNHPEEHGQILGLAGILDISLDKIRDLSE